MPQADRTPSTLIPTARRVPPATPAVTEHTPPRRAHRRQFLLDAGATIAGSLGVTTAMLSPDPVWGNAAASPANVDTDRLAAEYAEAAVADPDAALLALGHEFTACCEAEARAWVAAESPNVNHDEHPLYRAAVAANERTAGVASKIEACAATTLPGFLVKARAVAWCRTDEPIAADTFGFGQEEGAVPRDVRLMVGLLNDLAALARGFA